MNPKIGDYLSTAVRDHLNVFCSIMANQLASVPLAHSTSLKEN